MINLRYANRYINTALLIAAGTALSACSNDDNDNDGQNVLTCTPPEVLNSEQNSCISTTPTAPYAVDIFLKGGFSGWGAQDDYKFIFKNDAYYLDNVEFLPGVPEFKVADANWTLETTFTADLENVISIESDKTYQLLTGANAANMSLVIKESGLYDFKLLVGDDLLHPMLSYTHDIAPFDYDLYIRGGFNGWSTDNQVTYIGDDIYQITLKVAPGNHEFKFASADWSNEWVLSADEPVIAALDTNYTMVAGGPNATFFITETGYYTFTVDASNILAPVLRIVESDGSEGVQMNPHEGRENIEKITFSTYDGKEEVVTISADDITAQYRSYAHSTTQDLRDPGDDYVIYDEKQGQVIARTGNLAFDALFSLAVNETEKNSVSEIKDGNYNGGEPIPCNCFETGAKWHYVWTRDLSYAANLGLALLDPIRVKDSLEFKLSGYREGITKAESVAGNDEGIQIVQDTGSGGSWPISTDRVTWAFGAEKALQNLSGETRSAFAANAYNALVNTIENDRIAAFDDIDGLYNGEQSFLDWREQTYASWITKSIASLGSAKSLSTNAAHYKALTLTAKLAQEHGALSLASKYQSWADQLKADINKRFWLEDVGMYSSLTAGYHDLSALHKFDWLGQSLAIITGIADTAQATKILASYPHGDMGAPVIFPQQQDIAIYHNRAIWPFVTAYGLKAAVKNTNIAVANAAYTTLYRSAALNLSNMENLEWLSLQPNLLDFDNPSLSGPVINSKRQLWSVGAYVGMVIENIFGITTNDNGIDITPFITTSLHNEMFASSSQLSLQGLNLQGKSINLELILPTTLSEDEGYYEVQSITLNGTAISQSVLWQDLTDSNTLIVTLGDIILADSNITKVTADPLSSNDPKVFAPKEPTIERVFSDANGLLAVEFSDNQLGDISYNLFRNGGLIQENVAKGIVSDTILQADGEGVCYAVEAVFTSSNNYSHHSEPVCYGATQLISVAETRVETNVAISSADELIDKDYLSDWGLENDSLIVNDVLITSLGDYDIQLQYHNDYNAINLGVTNGVKWLQVKDSLDNIVAEGVIQMPHALVVDGKKPLVYSTPLTTSLMPGKYSLHVTDFYNMSYLESNTTYTGNGGKDGPMNRIDIAAIRIQSVKAIAN